MNYKLILSSLIFSFLLLNTIYSDEDLKLMSGDILSVQVFGNKEYNQECRVSSKGMIKVLGAGKFSVIGRSKSQLEVSIKNGLSVNSSLNKPEVLLLVSTPIERKIFVHGQFNQVQSIIIPFGQIINLRQLVSEVGGFKSGADIENVQIIRHIKPFNNKLVKRIDIDFLKLISNKKPVAFLMQPGDTVFVLELPPVTVVGAIFKPGSFKMNPGVKMDSLPLISKMGGFKNDAQKKFYSLTRSNKKYILPFTIEKNTDKIVKELLIDGIKPGDIIEVLSIDKVYVGGYVRFPGAYMAGNKEDLTVRKMIAHAGGARDEAKLTKVRVIRTTASGTTVKLVDASKINLKMNSEFKIIPGDYIHVPRSFY